MFLRRSRLASVLALAALIGSAQTASAFYYRYQTRESRMAVLNTDIGTSGRMRFYPTGGGSTACSGTIIADLPLSATAGVVSTAGSVDSGQTRFTFNAITAAAATASNTAVCATVTTSGGTVIINGLTVGTSGTNVILGSNVISSGTSVSVTSAYIAHG